MVGDSAILNWEPGVTPGNGTSQFLKVGSLDLNGKSVAEILEFINENLTQIGYSNELLAVLWCFLQNQGMSSDEGDINLALRRLPDLSMLFFWTITIASGALAYTALSDSSEISAKQKSNCKQFVEYSKHW